MFNGETRLAAVEASRIKNVYAARIEALDEEIYAPWQAAEILFRSERKRVAATLLKQVGSFPTPGTNCLEIGYGRLGWLADLLSWGLRAEDLHGIELDVSRGAIAQKAFNGADLRIGDASHLPWEDESFELIIVSTVFSSILSNKIRRLVAEEIDRVLAPGGRILWYDLRLNNPRNGDVRRINRSELMMLFGNYHATLRSVTLAPPIARKIAPLNFLMAELLGALPFLRTHNLAVLVKEQVKYSQS